MTVNPIEATIKSQIRNFFLIPVYIIIYWEVDERVRTQAEASAGMLPG